MAAATVGRRDIPRAASPRGPPLPAPPHRGRRHAVARLEGLPSAVGRAARLRVRVPVHDRRLVRPGLPADGLVGLLALVVGTLAGSSFLDAVDRRKLLMVAQVALMAGSGLLLAGAIDGDPPLALVYAGVAIIAGVSAIDFPTRSAITPRLVGAELLPSALALNQVVWNGTALVGPALAGITIARLGLAWAYAIDVVTYLAMLAAAISIGRMPPERSGRTASGVAA